MEAGNGLGQQIQGSCGQYAVGAPDISPEPTAEPRTHSSNDFLCAGRFSTRPALESAPRPELLWPWCDVWSVASPGGGVDASAPLSRGSAPISWSGRLHPRVWRRLRRFPHATCSFTTSGQWTRINAGHGVRELCGAYGCLPFPTVRSRLCVERWGPTGPLPHFRWS